MPGGSLLVPTSELACGDAIENKEEQCDDEDSLDLDGTDDADSVPPPQQASTFNSRESLQEPRTDKREYRRIVLGNSLQVLLISDPDTDKSAACMYVSIGHLSDPDGCEGLAHLLMRVLLLAYASEKYPGKDSYCQYIVEHGGYTEGILYPNQTDYHFNINNDCFEEALERFSQIFIKPLMSTEAAMREIKTVESASKPSQLGKSSLS
ncbi:Insulinase (Peptidase family M16) family protein, putative [Theobroma cacao]|uniref:Insulinase (Peptidase family M16) family protein, putative n=1 Tax=Theobroma cacao TaxID=3641 RepID=A0A061F414_THECC|nr:Insulinase (Peptidase family M16) family protein, putative [Theobroma cacao]